MSQTEAPLKEIMPRDGKRTVLRRRKCLERVLRTVGDRRGNGTGNRTRLRQRPPEEIQMVPKRRSVDPIRGTMGGIIHETD